MYVVDTRTIDIAIIVHDDDDVDDDPNNLLSAEKFDYEGDVCDCPDFANLEVSSQPLQLQYSTLC